MRQGTSSQTTEPQRKGNGEQALEMEAKSNGEEHGLEMQAAQAGGSGDGGHEGGGWSAEGGQPPQEQWGTCSGDAGQGSPAQEEGGESSGNAVPAQQQQRGVNGLGQRCLGLGPFTMPVVLVPGFRVLEFRV